MITKTQTSKFLKLDQSSFFNLKLDLNSYWDYEPNNSFECFKFVITNTLDNVHLSRDCTDRYIVNSLIETFSSASAFIKKRGYSFKKKQEPYTIKKTFTEKFIFYLKNKKIGEVDFKSETITITINSSKIQNKNELSKR